MSDNPFLDLGFPANVAADLLKDSLKRIAAEEAVHKTVFESVKARLAGMPQVDAMAAGRIRLGEYRKLMAYNFTAIKLDRLVQIAIELGAEIDVIVRFR